MSYDIVIAGGGSAGAVLANRLSADPKQRVLLLEAGDDTPPGNVPAAVLDAYPSVAYFNPDWHWRDLRVTYERLGSNQPENFVPRRYEQARLMGGGSSINGMIAIRGLPSDFDSWVEAGAVGWSYDDVLPFYRRLETDLDYDGPLHGKAGPLPIRRIKEPEWPDFPGALRHAILDSCFAERSDHNGEFDDGLFPIAINNSPSGGRDGHRVSTAMAYLDMATRARENLEIWPNCRVARVLIDDKRVNGVALTRNGQDMTVTARQVVISCGALHSPAMLMRSGIGPGHHLREHGIDVVADRPGVGQGLQDHPTVTLMGHIKRAWRLPADVRRHLHLCLRFSSHHDGCPPGDMFTLAAERAGPHPLGHLIAGFVTSIYRTYSVGEVGLKSADPDVEPTIHFNFFSDGRDLDRLVDALRLTYRFMTHESVSGGVLGLFPSSFNEKARDLAVASASNWIKTKAAALLLDLPLTRHHMMKRFIAPGIDVHQLFADDDALRQWVRDNASGNWHAASTCRIGNADDRRAVVDPACRVIGVDGLRVADASVMPSVVSANTNLTTIMIGEKVAETMLRG